MNSFRAGSECLKYLGGLRKILPSKNHNVMRGVITCLEGVEGEELGFNLISNILDRGEDGVVKK